MGEVINLKDRLSTELSTGEETEEVVYKNAEVFNEREIYKSNRLIESSYKLSTSQNRLIYLAMLKLKKIILDKNMNLQQVEEAVHDAKFDKIYVDVIDYKKIYNINSNNLYGEIARVAHELQQEIIWYYDEKEKLTSINWITYCQYDDENKRVAIEFNSRLIKDLMIFKNKFTRMILDSFKKVKLKYSFRIYELCKQYQKIGKRDFTIKDLRFKLRLGDDEYKAYGDFKKCVILPSVKEISKYTDLKIDFSEIEKDKKTKKVNKIRFTISNNDNIVLEDKILTNPEKQMSIFEDNQEDSSMLDEEVSVIDKLYNIIGVDITAGEADAILTASLETIEEMKLDMGVLDYIIKQNKICKEYSNREMNKGKNVNYVALLISALRGKWENKKLETIQDKKIEIRVDGIDTVEDLEKLVLGRNKKQEEENGEN